MSSNHQFKLAGFRFADPSDAAAIKATYGKLAADLLQQHGLYAFEQPRSAALAHEVSHAIVNQHDGARTERIKVWKDRGLWGGYADVGSRKRLTCGSGQSAEINVKRICFTIAGLVGEIVLDPDGVRPASSIDELIISQCIASGAAGDNASAERLWRGCWRRTGAILRHNEPTARELIARLDRTESLRGRALHGVLSRVKQIVPDKLNVEELIKIGGSDA